MNDPKNAENVPVSVTKQGKLAENGAALALSSIKLATELKFANSVLQSNMGLGNAIKQMESVLRPFSSEMVKMGAVSQQIQKALEPFATSMRLQAETLASANKAIFDAVNTVARLHQPITFDLAKVIRKLPDFTGHLSHVERLHLAFAKIAANDGAVFSPSALKSFAELGSSIRPFAKDFSVVQGAFSKYLAGKEFATSVHRFDCLAIASREYFNSGNLLLANSNEVKLPEETRELQLEEQAKIESQTRTAIEKNLAVINPKLLQLWHGAVKATESNNPERTRHALTSLRALFDHLLDVLAPKERVSKWITDPKDFMDKASSKEPTRRARLKFIYASIDTPEFGAFLKADITSVLSLYAVFNDGTHGLDSAYSDAQLYMIFRRFEGAICGLVEMSLGRSQ